MRFLLTLFLISLLLSSCLKEDLNSISQIESDASWLIPFVELEIDFTDIIKDEEYVQIDQDSLIHFIYRIDSINSINADQIVDLTLSESINKQQQIGPIEIADISSELAINLSQLTQNLDAELVESLEIASQLPFAYFPALDINSAGLFAYEPFLNFTNLHLTSADLTIELQNNLSVDIELLKLVVFDDVSQVIVDEFDFNNIASSNQAIQTITLQNINLSNNLSVEVYRFITPGSGDNPEDESSYVPISLSDEIVISLALTDVQINEGVVIMPNIEIDYDSLSLSVNSDNDINITQGNIGAGLLQIQYASYIQHPIVLSLEIPNLLLDGAPYFQQIELQYTPFEPVFSQVDLSYYQLIFNDTSDSIQLITSIEVQSNGELIDFNSNDAIFLNISLFGIEFSYIQGYFGQTNFDIPTGEIVLNTEFANQFDDDLLFENPKLSFITYNEIGVPMEMDLNLSVEVEPQEIQLFGSELPINNPDISQVNAGVYTTTEFDVNNSNIYDLINSHADKLTYSGYVQTNPQNESVENTLDMESALNIDVELDLPLNIKMSQMQFVDTIKLTPGIGNLDYSIQFRTFIKNDFPFEADVTFVFRDSITNNALDSLTFYDIGASEVNAQGTLIKPYLYDRLFIVQNSLVDAIYSANQLVAKVQMKAPVSQESALKIYSNHKVSVNIGLILDVQNVN